MKMQIKWIDQHNGVADFARWAGISRTRALEMLKRHDPKEYDTNVFHLAIGKEVTTKNYVLREIPND